MKREKEHVERGDHLRNLTCKDIWNADNSKKMVEALSWICEEIVMTEAVRVLLCHASERNRVLHDRAGCASSWWPKYTAITWEKDKGGRRFARFEAVVNSCLGNEQCFIVWTGVPGKACGADANCDTKSCTSVLQLRAPISAPPRRPMLSFANWVWCLTIRNLRIGVQIQLGRDRSLGTEPN